MRIYLGNRDLEPELEGQKRLAVRELSRPREELVVEKTAPYEGPLFPRADFLLRYDVFPPKMLRAYGQWQAEGRELMKPGDTIVQEAAMPPFSWGARLLFGARVTDVTRTESEVSFTYKTLESHAETGINTFALRLIPGRVLARVTSRAEPGRWSMKLAGPVVMTYADWCKDVAARRMLALFGA